MVGEPQFIFPQRKEGGGESEGDSYTAYRDGKEDAEANTSKESIATECTLVVGGTAGPVPN